MDTNAQNAEATLKFLEKRNRGGDNLLAIYDKCSTDMSFAEAACLQVLFDYDGNIAEVFHIPVEDVRMEAPNQYGMVEYFYVSKNWAKISNARNKKTTANNSAVRVKAWQPESYREYPVQMLYIKKYSPASYYSIPSYVSTGGIDAILTDGLLISHEYQNLLKKYFITGMLVQQGNPSDAEMSDFIDDFNALYQNSKNSSRMLFSWVDSMENKPELINLQNQQSADFFEKMKNKIEEVIIQAHNAFPESSGKVTKGADLGGTGNALYIQIKAFEQLVCTNLRDTLLSGFNRIMEHNLLGFVTAVAPELRVEQPELDTSVLTEDEKRWIMWGLEAKKPEDKNNDTDEIPEN